MDRTHDYHDHGDGYLCACGDPGRKVTDAEAAWKRRTYLAWQALVAGNEDEARRALEGLIDPSGEMFSTNDDVHEHEWTIVQEVGVGPVELICGRCSESRKVSLPSEPSYDAERGVYGG